MTTTALLKLGGLVFAATLFIVWGDIAGKLLGQSGVDPLFVAWSRLALGALLMLPVSGLKPSELPFFFHGPVVLRAALVSSAIACILTALKTAPMANVFGGFFLGPMVAYALAVLCLGEKTSWFRTALLGIGFVGVLLVVKPGFGAEPGLIFALLAGLFWGGFLASTQWLAGRYRPSFLLLSQLAIGGVLLAPLGLWGGLPPWSAEFMWLVTASAACSAIGNYMLVQANRRGDGSVIAPLIYTMLISATIGGFLVFGDLPDWIAVIGLCLILGSGLGTLASVRQRTAPT